MRMLGLGFKASVDDALAPHRERVMYALSIVGGVCLLPFAVNDFAQGRALLAWAILVVLATLAVDAVAIHRGKRPPIPFALLLIPMAVGMGISLHTQGVIGPLWCYPTVLFIFFVLTRRMANLCGFALLVAGTVMVQRYVGTPIAVRFAVTLALTMLIINIILSIIGELQARLLDQAITDPLTGAYNRHHMVAVLAAPALRPPAALLLIDVDHFKSINDRHGHEAGDGVLARVAVLACSEFGGAKLFRLGGDEFLLYLPGASVHDAVARGERLRADIAAARLLGGEGVTVSIGVAALAAGASLDAWIHGADTALYEAKRAGRNRVVAAPDGRIG